MPDSYKLNATVEVRQIRLICDLTDQMTKHRSKPIYVFARLSHDMAQIAKLLNDATDGKIPGESFLPSQSDWSGPPLST